MSKTINRVLSGVRQGNDWLVLVVTGLAMTLVAGVESRWARMRASGDRGSESVEKAITAAVSAAVAIGLMIAIRAAVESHQAQIK
ncbi:hypothetical protein [Amycolatopsis sp. NPDC058986]|uniref:hypothetical protein n=1 Tax=unclassified Amycolatopsis TaxID=2618356 RepID=UPI003671297A